MADNYQHGAWESDATTADHLRKLGLGDARIEILQGYANAENLTLRQLVRYVLRDYAPAQDGPEVEA